MTGRTRKLGTLLAVAAAALAISTGGARAAPAAGDTDDSYNPPSTTVTGNAGAVLTATQCGGHTPPAGTVTCFAIPGASPVIVVFCSRSNTGGKTPATGVKPFTIRPPVFDDGSASLPCTDSLHGTDTSTTNSTHGKWKVGLTDAANDETGTEPNNGDKLTVTVPSEGVVVVNSLGCTITVNPRTGPTTFKSFKVTGTYDDVSKFTVAISNLPIVTVDNGGCPLPVTAQSSFNAIYTFTPGVTDGS